MRKVWLAIRSAILWSLSILHFFIVAPTLVLLGIFLDVTPTGGSSEATTMKRYQGTPT